MNESAKRAVIGVDVVILWLMTAGYLVNWDRMFNLEGSLKTMADAWRSHPVIGLLLPVNDTLLFDAYRWIVIAGIVAALITYSTVDFLWTRSGSRVDSYSHAVKLISLSLIITALVLLPTVKEMTARRQVGAWSHANDNVIQSEAAVEMLLDGRNPYGESFINTPLGRFQDSFKNPDAHPALYHFVYLPADIVFSVPFFVISKPILGWYDQRLLYLILFMGTVWLLYRILPRSDMSLGLTAAFALNPFMVPFIIEGRNDVFTLFWVVLGIALFKSMRYAGGWMAIAVGCAHKQFAWFLLPFLPLYAGGVSGLTWPEIKAGLIIQRRGLIWFGLIFGIIVLPFFLWSPLDFFDDVLGYGLGMSKSSMPIEGVRSYGFGTVVLYKAWVSSWNDRFPFWVFQVLFALPLLMFAVRAQVRNNQLATVLIGSSLVLLVFTFFSRFLHDNHLGYITSLFIIGYAIQNHGLESQSTVES